MINVEVPKLPGRAAPGETETMPVVVGPDNPDFAPYEQISPYLVASIMTTEDNGFFKHHGWVSSEFKSALRRNLAAGRFPPGRVVDHHADGEERPPQPGEDAVAQAAGAVSGLVPRAGAAQGADPRALLQRHRVRAAHLRHRRGDAPLLRQEAGRAQSARGGVLLVDPPQPQAALRAVLPRLAVAAVGQVHPPHPGEGARARAGSPTTSTRRTRRQPLVFDRSEATFTEKQCLDWVKRMAPKPEPETPPDLDEEPATTPAAPTGRRNNCGGSSRTPSRTRRRARRRPRRSSRARTDRIRLDEARRQRQGPVLSSTA